MVTAASAYGLPSRSRATSPRPASPAEIEIVGRSGLDESFGPAPDETLSPRAAPAGHVTIDADALVAAVDSGATDRADEAIEAVTSLGAQERLALLADAFDPLADACERAHPARRRSAVRALEALSGGLPAASEAGRPSDADDWPVRLAALYLRTMRDEDERVRAATGDAIRALGLQCALRDEGAVLRALAEGLDDLEADDAAPGGPAVEAAREQLDEILGRPRPELRAAIDDAVAAYDPEEWDEAEGDGA